MGQRETFFNFLSDFWAYFRCVKLLLHDSWKRQSTFEIYSFHMPAFIFCLLDSFSKHAIKQRKYLRLLSFVWLYLLAKLLIALANFAFAK